MIKRRGSIAERRDFRKKRVERSCCVQPMEFQSPPPASSVKYGYGSIFRNISSSCPKFHLTVKLLSDAIVSERSWLNGAATHPLWVFNISISLLYVRNLCWSVTRKRGKMTHGNFSTRCQHPFLIKLYTKSGI